MTAEELAEVMKLVNANRPQVMQTMNFHGPIGQQIAHVDTIEAHFDKDMKMQIVNAEEVAVTDASQATMSVPTEELCHLIHPCVTDDAEKWKIHNEIVNLVRNNMVQDICAYLDTMMANQKVLLPLAAQSALDELRRMGMPGEEVEGYSYKTFCRYYRK